MVRFGICDDNYKYMKRAEKIICTKFDELKTFDEECSCIFYRSGKELFEHFEQDNIDIYFLDIECGEENGFEIARKLKKLKKDVAIVYITNYRHYIVDAFICRPLGFICKDTIDHDICVAMSNIVEYLEEKKSIITFNIGKSKYGMEAYKIISAQVCNHSLVLNLSNNKKIAISGSLSEYEKQFKEKGFVQISRGVLVNKNFVSYISHGKIILSNGEILTVSRRRIKEVQQSCRL